MGERDGMWDGKGVDPWLPHRLAAESRIVAAERRLYSHWWGSYSSWLVKVNRAVMAGHVPDPHAVWGFAPAWAERMDEFARGPVKETMGQAYRGVFGPDYRFDDRPAVARHLAEVTNRMVRTPEAVFDEVASVVAKGAGAGESIPQIRDRVEAVIGKTGIDNWRGRAVTVARTEAIGALNAGRGDMFSAVADELGGEFDHQWLATLDARVRAAHRAADTQRVPISQPFTVDGEHLIRPGAPGGRASNVVNCRCSELLVRPDEAVDLSGRGFKDADEYWASQLAGGDSSAPVYVQPQLNLGVDLIGHGRRDDVTAAILAEPNRYEGDSAMHTLAHLQGFDARPRVVSKQGLDALISQRGTPELWRGVRASGGKSAAEIHEQMRTGEAYFGGGTHGSGYYVTPSRALAEQYSDGTPGSVARLTIDDEAEVEEYSKLDEEVDKYLDELTECWNPPGDGEEEKGAGGEECSQQESVVFLTHSFVLVDPGRYAAMRGVDVAREKSRFYVVMNRSAMIVEEAAAPVAAVAIVEHEGKGEVAEEPEGEASKEEPDLSRRLGEAVSTTAVTHDERQAVAAIDDKRVTWDDLTPAEQQLVTDIEGRASLDDILAGLADPDTAPDVRAYLAEIAGHE